MRFAIYSRKSKWTGKGESIENQLVMCKEYIMASFPDVKDEDIYEYEDEGFSGKNTLRPQFQKMMSDLRKNHYDYLVCYKLDRLGRNLSDLVNLIEELNKMDISFISIKEKFDTSTPIGRAMMFFTGVLAQMEREQIAERVRDNMLMLARSGRWLGGTTPLGFYSKKDEVLAWNNKIKTSYKLTVNEKEMETVRFIYHEFLEKQSLTQIDTYFAQNRIRTRNGKEYQISTIRDILTNPVYCTADQEACDYFVRLGCQVCIEPKELDGIHGLISYGKTSSSKYKNKQNTPSEWIVSAAKHKGIIKGGDWVRVQQLLEQNKKKGDSFRKVQNPISLLSGILYCTCGYPMRPKYYRADRLDEKGNRTFAYICSGKEKSNGKNCNIPNVHGNALDQLVCNEVLEYVKPDSVKLLSELRKLKENDGIKQYNDRDEEEMLGHLLVEKRDSINRLLVTLGRSSGNETFLHYVEQQVNRLDEECRDIEKRIREFDRSELSKKDYLEQMDMIKSKINTFANAFETLSVLKKREYLQTVLEKVVWNGETAKIYLLEKTKDGIVP
jgi:site-specific DNA recombinase